jgi:hypothetical protein
MPVSAPRHAGELPDFPTDPEKSMANATDTPRKTVSPMSTTGCGNCTYSYNNTDGCYHRQSYGCSANCSCAPIICGLGSQLIQCLYPSSKKASVGVALPCSPSGSDEEASANSLLEVIRGLNGATTFWKRVSIGLGLLSGLLVIGLVVAVLYR